MAFPQSKLRKYPRAPANFPAECLLEDATFQARALNLGGGGLFLRMPRQLAPGKALSLRFRPARHLPPVDVAGKVVYQLEDQGVGIEFTHINPEDRQAILRLVLHRAALQARDPRKPFVTQVVSETAVILGFSRSLSVGGLFIETKEPPPEGSEIRLRFHLDNGGPIIVVTAEVRYVVQGVGMGVHFLDLSAADRNRIDVYMTRGESGTDTSPR